MARAAREASTGSTQEGYFDNAITDEDATDGRSSDEGAPLLRRESAQPPGPSRSFQQIVVAMCVLFLFIAEVSTFLMDAPAQAIMEDIICHNHYPDHELGQWKVTGDGRCKNPDVQKTLAMVRSWSMATDNLIPVIVQVPFGILADKYGRRPILFISFVGCVLNVSWQFCVLAFPNIFSIWAILFGSLAYAIGGGAAMVLAMLYTIVSDVTPPEGRSKVFFLIRALALILHVAVNPISAFLISIDPWISLWLGMAAFIIGLFSSLLIPETLHLHQAAQPKPDDHEVASAAGSELDGDEDDASLSKGGIWRVIRENSASIWHFIFQSKHVTILTFAYSLDNANYSGFQISLLQYMAKRYDWDWSMATFMATFGYLTCVVVLLIFLPLASTLMTSRMGMSALSRDLRLSQASIVFTAIGALMAAFAFTPWVMVVALVTYSFGSGFSSICRALLMAVIEPHMVATLNTIISVFQAALGLVSQPTMGWLLARGLEIGGAGTGLLYGVIFVLTVFVGVAVFRFKVPPGYA